MAETAELKNINPNYLQPIGFQAAGPNGQHVRLVWMENGGERRFLETIVGTQELAQFAMNHGKTYLATTAKAA